MSTPHHNHSHHHEDVKNISAAFFLNVFFTVVEFVGGFLTNSVAILSDAVHDLGDSFSLGLSWYFQKVAKRGSNAQYTYGYKRFSLLGAVINSIILTVGSVLVLTKSVPRLFHPEQPDAKGMLFLAILGVVMNGAAVLRLRKGHSINERVVSLHMMEDVLGWAAVLVGAIVMMFANVPILDPILSIAIAVYVLSNVYKNIKDSLRIILQGAPVSIKTDEVRDIALSFPEVESVHDLHLWSVDGEYNVLTIHAVLNAALSMEELNRLKIEIRARMEEHNVQHSSIEFELPGEDCGLDGCC